MYEWWSGSLFRDEANHMCVDSRTEIRSILIDEIQKDIVGPRGGENEALPKRENPVHAYLSGILFPKRTPIDMEDDERNYTAASGDDDSPDEHYDYSNIGIKPASFGLTCTIAGRTGRILARIDYGVYSLTERKTGRKAEVFQRTPYSEEHIICLNDEQPKPKSLQANPDFLLRYSIKRRSGNTVLSIFVVNDHIHRGPDAVNVGDHIFQPRITLSSPDGDRIFIDDGTRTPPGEDDQDSGLFELLFSGKRNFAIGHGCSVEWSEDDIRDHAVSKLETAFIPKYTVPKIRPREIEAEGLDMKKLYGVQDFSEYEGLLSPIADEYEEWIAKELESKMDTLPQQVRQAAKDQIGECRYALKRIRRGIRIVSQDKIAGEAFSFANRAMLLQISHVKWAQKNAGKAKSPGPAEYSGRWRPFQLTFILSNIESISDPKSEDRKIADLLWFATGGGKTEAYMGIIAFAMAHRRLRNAPVDYLRYGTVVIMRYALRLLTLQQFHRAAALMCACEFIRRRNVDKWGGEPFLVGLWVGMNTTPNRLDNAADAIRDARLGKTPRTDNPIQIISCPWCGSKIDAYCYRVGGTIRQCRIYCPNKSCEFSESPGAEDANLPVLVVDEDIYKRCPSLIIGTVDKFAQISWRWETGAIFGRVNKYCEKHGFVVSELARSCGNHKKYESYLFENYGSAQLEPPELIIQDELHMISGPLGTLTGLYETAIDILCTNDDGISPKIIASTATAKRADDQILGLFNRRTSKIFPPPGFSFGQSFFAEEVPLDRDPGKTYLGITSAKSGLIVLGRLSAVMLRKVRHLMERAGENPFQPGDLDRYYTLVSYFNTLRELGGASKMYDDTVPRFVQRIYSNFEGKPLESGSRYRDEPLEKKELTSRVDSSDIPDILQRLDVKLGDSARPVDVLLCTNMLSVGVDISRLGVMIVNGQPKNHSEYIQASGRIGRDSPGLVVANYSYLKPRDLSHYENFGYYHSTLHKNVEAISLTPFAPRARDKALFGVFVALVRLLERRLASNPDAERFDVSAGYISRRLAHIRSEVGRRVGSIDYSEKDGTLKDLDRLIGEWDRWATDHTKPIVYRKNLHERAKPRENMYYLLGSVESTPEGIMMVPNSLRDAEQSIKLRYLSDLPRGG